MADSFSTLFFESASFVLDKFRYSNFSADGDARLQFETPQTGELARHFTTPDFNSSEGVVQLDLLNRQTAENVWVISTQQTGVIGAGSVVINNLTYQPDECED
ncbi:MAG: hypothetical protein ACWA5R_08665 [bacterium]